MAEKIDYLFIPSNDSQAEWMLPISNLLLNAKFMIFESRRENSSELLNSYLTDYISYEPGILENLQPSMVILGNDWGFEELLILLEANSLSIKSVCIQDGAIIYPDRVRRLLNSDFLLAFGKKTLDYFPHPNAYLTGNPKFDRYYLASIPEKPKVMINYNFTYGIYTDFGKQWLQDVISVLDDLKIEGFISIHPRTFISNEWAGNYEIIKSSDIPLTDQIYRSSIVISRFSTVIYEAIASGRKVIYYNPHHENFDLFKGGYKDIIIETSSKEDLKHLMLDHHNSKNDINIKDWNEFIRHHLTTIDRNSAFLCAKSLMEILNKSTGGLMHQEKSQILSRELVRSSLYFYRDFVGMQRSLISKNEYQLFNDRKRGVRLYQPIVD